MYLVFHSFTLVTWIYLELPCIIEDVTEYPRDCKTKQVLGPAIYKDAVGAAATMSGSAKTQGTTSG